MLGNAYYYNNNLIYHESEYRINPFCYKGQVKLKALQFSYCV